MDSGRQEWDRPAEFLFAIIGYSVGIGNVWRFPYTCYESGGGNIFSNYSNDLKHVSELTK